jgi:starch synthase
MKIAMIASEANPFAKTGGLADVLGALSVALEHLGHEVTVILPAYRCALRGGFVLQETGRTVAVPVGDGQESGTVLRASINKNVSALLIRADRYFDREFLYGTATADYPDNAERFTFFCRAALEVLRQDEPADIIHAHDWQAALAIVFPKTQAADYPEMAGVKPSLRYTIWAFRASFRRANGNFSISMGLFSHRRSWNSMARSIF